VQVDPMKPPGTKRLKLKCDILLSTYAFKFNLRRYNEQLSADDDMIGQEDLAGLPEVEAYTSPLLSST